MRSLRANRVSAARDGASRIAGPLVAALLAASFLAAAAVMLETVIRAAPTDVLDGLTSPAALGQRTT